MRPAGILVFALKAEEFQIDRSAMERSLCHALRDLYRFFVVVHQSDLVLRFVLFTWDSECTTCWYF